MTCTEQLLRLAQLYAEAEGITFTTVSWRVFGDTKKLDAVRTGSDLQTRRFEAAREWFSNNWPEGVPWPDGVVRPEVVA